MAATIATRMAMINSKCLNNTGTPKLLHHKLITTTLTHKPTTTTTTKVTGKNANVSTATSISMTGTAIAGAIFASLGSSDSAFAAQQIAEIEEGSDNRGFALLLPLIPAIAWVLFNILQPALNQINRMRSTRGLIVGLGLGGLLAGSGEAWASEMGMIGDAAAAAAAAGGSDNRGQLLLFVVAPAIVWVLYNILQPALNQLNRMRSQ